MQIGGTKRIISRALSAAGVAVVLAVIGLACASGGDAPGDGGASAPEPGFTRCVEPRHPVCTRDYRPVCAQTTDAADGWKTYPNACTACADAAVIGHRAGECPAP